MSMERDRPSIYQTFDIKYLAEYPNVEYTADDKADNHRLISAILACFSSRDDFNVDGVCEELAAYE
ncbi:MAG: hypothetical protein AAGL17_17795, partial [Cyanobacteria bacterium J06576_12]